MPDDTEANEQVVDSGLETPEEANELDAAFDEDDGDTTAAEAAAEAAAAEEQTPEEKAADEAEAAAAEEQTPEEKEAEEKAAVEKAAADEEAKAAEAAKAAESEEDKAAREREAAAAKKPTEPTEKQKAAAEKAATEAKDTARSEFLDGALDSLKDMEIGDGGTEEAPMPKTMGEFVEMFPEISNAMKAMMGHMFDKMTGEITPVREMITSQAQAAAEQALYETLGDEKHGHPDAADIIASDDFQEWGNKQSERYQEYMDAVTDAADIAQILNRFKSETGVETKTDEAKAAADEKKAEAERVAKDQREAKAKKDKLNAATTRQKKSVQKSGETDSDEDLDSAFDEEADA